MNPAIPTPMVVGALSAVVALLLGATAFLLNRDTDEKARQANRVLFTVLAIAVFVGCIALGGFAAAGANQRIQQVVNHLFSTMVTTAWVVTVALAVLSWMSRRNQPRQVSTS